MNQNHLLSCDFLSLKRGKLTSFAAHLRRLSRRRNPLPFSPLGPPLLMGKQKSKKKSTGWKSPAGSTSPNSPSSKASIDKHPSDPGSIDSADSPTNASAQDLLMSSAIENTTVETSTSPDVKAISPASESPITVIQKSDASAVVPTISSAIKEGPMVDSELVHKSEAETTHVQATPDKVVADLNGTVVENSWADLLKGSDKILSKKGESFVLPSGETCVKIPNSIIQKNMKSWESFIIGQFYADPPPQALIHTIVNGIWSRQFKDIAVSKLEGNAFLFRIPNSQTRRRVLNQRLWQIEGQTMFVADWQPGMIPVKPELTTAPIWLELRNVPLQFFNEDGLERIASLVGDPKALHPATANKTNLEVAKVFTIIDPRKSLPEAVNVQFESGDIVRIDVSSPWMPPICSHCKEVGHSLKRCRLAPPTCTSCNSTVHSADACPRIKGNGTRKPLRTKNHHQPSVNYATTTKVFKKQRMQTEAKKVYRVKDKPESSLQFSNPLSKDIVLLIGDSSKSEGKKVMVDRSIKSKGSAISEPEGDSSDTMSTEEHEVFEEEYYSGDDHEFSEVVSKRNRGRFRGIGPKFQ